MNYQIGNYQYINSKKVIFYDELIDYVWWKDIINHTYIFTLGNLSDCNPYTVFPDWECETLTEAEEWFNSYEGEDDEDYNFFMEDFNPDDEL